MSGLLPEGFHDRLPPAADAATRLESRVLGVARGYGYEQVDPPLAEFADELSARLKAAGGLRDAVRFVDPVSQRTLAIRPDLTAQIGRIAATRMGHHPRPVRLSYAGPVMKLSASELDPLRATRQIGAELIGLDTVAAAISEESEPGLGTVRPSFTTSYYEEPGFFTGLVRMTDPINNRRMMGIARVDLAEQEMDFFTLGPSEPVGRFALAPGGKKAWALYGEVGRYEFWAIDLEEGRVTHREPFQGRPRMGLAVSTNGKYLYIHVAGNTIDIYDSETYEHVRTVDVGGDMRGFVFLPGPDRP